ncbi:site-specific DNA methylase [Owenweeksia hongkongensis DSM 17368]|uniref:DNA (cytosine-5-)-methyltransferase n=1 Tax=Owenweeksia hongkongensis (strain DSM 17368 / CIP 108786 / JCM 12287 / NRRL B-23963 / UST20020801) TaxID=926562 RepID=G8R486_OWEHD|nr:DNA cytosine methyltransferase [Owenweeksia hongkongensis]AEV34186.1 site-specific DNA methylase [Owenweeksia hongkongensis DSM 17368]
MINIKIIDLFCGAGGLTSGASKVDNVQVIACVNHDAKAIESHKANHPEVVHFTEDVRNPEMIHALAKMVQHERELDPDCIILVWASLECTNFSKAKGGLPRDADSRTLAECLYTYIDELNPDGLWIENVEEFMAWGPLDDNGKPLSRNKGEDYINWRDTIIDMGFAYEYGIFNAADYGAFTSRKRFFAQFMREGLPIIWPQPTHSKTNGTLPKWKAVKSVLDFTDKGQSIFTRKKPLVENTLKRIYAGLVKYVAGGDESFLAQYNGGGHDQRVYGEDRPLTSISTNNRHALVQPDFLIDYQYNSSARTLENPAPTILTKDHHALVQPEFLYRYHGNGPNLLSPDAPCTTVTTKDRVAAVWVDKQYSGELNHQSVQSPAGTLTTNPKLNIAQAEFLVNPQYNNKGSDVDKPCFTLIARMDKMPPYLVQVEDTMQVAILIYPEDSETLKKIKLFMAAYGISDIYMRMLRVDELLAIQGFPKGYILNGTQADQKKFIGNAVEVNMGFALIAAQATGLQNLKEAVA